MFLQQCFCSELDSLKDKFQLGFAGAISQKSTLSTDLYSGFVFYQSPNRFEIHTGYTFFKNTTSYKGVKGLWFESHGLFLEGNYFLNPYFYAGIRFSYNLNKVSEESRRKFDTYPDIESPTLFSGGSGFFQLGLLLPIGTRLCMRFQGQLGLHNYKIGEGALLLNSSDSDVRNATFGIERHNQLLYNLSTGLVFKLKK